MEINKIILEDNGHSEVPMDLTNTTAVGSDVVQGKNFYTAAGVLTEGSHQEIVPTGTIDISINGTTNVANYAEANVNVPSNIPEEISTEAAMNELLIPVNIGKCYKYVGTTGTYTNGDIYIVEGE